MIKLSIIIVTYNSLQHIFNCLESIYQFNDLEQDDFEIIIVENGSLESFNEMSRHVSDKYGERIKMVKNEQNKGYGQGNNVGVRLASGKYICIANPDIIFKAPVFKKALKLFKENKQLAMIGGKQSGGRNSSFLNRPEYDFFILTAFLSDSLNKINLYFQKFFYLSGALLFIDKDKFFEIGLFDESFFLYFEESDITQRFLKKKYSTKFIKEFTYDHFIGDRSITVEETFDIEIDSVKKYCLKYDFSFKSFVNKRILSYKIMKFLFKIIGKEERVRTSEIYLSRYLKIKKNHYK
ncbi:hypothetical protein BA768_11085 [Chryseobacterium sp. CBo1]|uniref:glycosyltransferase family 2 protein n=1 Tax=Chryseobacterium sp. CBo1 TaxID=1869230 RepID=UPI000810C7E6|nr:glycosyltransferase family 2 protein [Chryseobacterium sp. CBo1]OCK52655.1 hypothetical protein BA768_11085 [Chryseobacterium sp. CBo1]